MLEQMRNHPISAVLGVSAVAALLLEKSGGGRKITDSYGARGVDAVMESTGDWRETGEHLGRAARGAVESSKEKLREFGESAHAAMTPRSANMKGKVSSAISGAKQAIDDASGQASSYGRKVARSLGDSYSSAAEKTAHSLDTVRGAAGEYPIAFGGAAFALGLLVGLLVPRTGSEDTWLGEAAGDMAERVKGKGQELMSRGKEVLRDTAAAAKEHAQEVADSARDSAKRHGLSADDLSSGISGDPNFGPLPNGPARNY